MTGSKRKPPSEVRFNMANATLESQNLLSDLLVYQERLAGDTPTLAKLREKGAQAIRTMPFPTTKDEDWRFTSLKALSREEFTPADELDSSVEASEISSRILPEAESTHVVFINGKFSDEHSDLSGMPEGAHVATYQQLEDQNPEFLENHVGNQAAYEDDIFAQFNDAFTANGLGIVLDKNTVVASPIQVLYLYTDADSGYFATPRLTLSAGPFAEATLVEHHVGLADNAYLTIPQIEIDLAENAQLKHVKVQRDSKAAYHIARPSAHVAKHANYRSYTITLGAKLFRNDPRITQKDEEVAFTLDGLVLIGGDQVADTHSTMDHRHPHGNSHQLHKVVVSDNAHSIFNGKIFVRQHAQKIDSFQENRNLLLSRNGTIDTKPQLEIFADDVLCSHGATVGQLEEDEVFYLQSRGISRKKAVQLLTKAFAFEIIENIAVDSLREQLVEEVESFTSNIDSI